jgi:hypothetical protein
MTSGSLGYLEGRRFCVVFVKVMDPVRERVQLQCFRGRASIERGRLTVISAEGAAFAVPSSALATILPNDGTRLLGDAEYYALVKVDKNIEFMTEIDFTSMNG